MSSKWSLVDKAIMCALILGALLTLTCSLLLIILF